jgi:hypothetical protein
MVHKGLTLYWDQMKQMVMVVAEVVLVVMYF